MGYNLDISISCQNENYIFKCNDYNKQYQHIMSSGLNNLEYKFLERKNINDYVELIKVSI